MFSYLRPHRRTPSNPSSPGPEQPTPWDASLRSPPDHAHPQRYPGPKPTDAGTKTNPILSLPPIARAADDDALLEINSRRARERTYEREHETQNLEGSKESTMPTFSNYLSTPAAPLQRPGSAGNPAPSQQSSFQHFRPQMGNQDFQQRPGDSNFSFVRQPTGTRLPTPPPSASNAVSNFESSRSGKRLNLLNPMALLARRRTNQSIPPTSTESITSNRVGNHFNDSFDPRIKGTVVHDFSAPRPKRVVPPSDFRAEDSGPKQFPQNRPRRKPTADQRSNGSWGSTLTAAATEDLEGQPSGPHVRKISDMSDPALANPLYTQDPQKLSDASLINNNGSVKGDGSSDQPGAPPVPPKTKGRPPIEPRRISIETTSTSSKSSPSKQRQSRKASDVSLRDGGSPARPKHMKSTSSRFSFDMIGAAEQERLLEDRHRQRALERANEKADGGEFDDFDEEFNYDDMDGDDDLEERIPGVNADYDDDEEPYNYLGQQVPYLNPNGTEAGGGLDNKNPPAFTFELPTPLSPARSGAIGTARDFKQDEPVIAKKPPPTTTVLSSKAWRASSTFGPPRPDSVAGGLEAKTSTSSSVYSQPEPEKQKDPEPSELPQQTPEMENDVENDDLYFDDGMIGELGEDHESGEFDESVFDNVDTDEYGRPLKAFAPLPTLYSPPTLPPDTAPEAKDDTPKTARRKDTVSTETGPIGFSLAPQPSISGARRDEPSSLTQDSLAAYQSALAAAAFDAAANGKFRRDSTQTLPTHSEPEDTHPGLISDSSHTSHYEPFSPNYDFEDDFDYDDTLEDDPIIAAANAEALANDMDGFYGQEFGFYSAPSAGEAEYANGGYFGPRGSEAVGRSQSGRVASREPNLTPITERSEYSNRNSFMSLPMHGASSVVNNPGLAQLAGMPEYEGDMSLDALLKLRRGAWGGSQVSLHSSNGSPRSAGPDETSPQGQPAPWTQSGVSTLPMGGHKRQNSALSGFSITSEGVSGLHGESSPAPPSPTLLPVLVSEDEQEVSKDFDHRGRRHRYTESAESISYSKPDDPQSPTGERWVVERKRTSDQGVELLGREVVGGGNI